MWNPEPNTQVICVDDKFDIEPDEEYDPDELDGLREGEIYTIKRVDIAPIDHPDNGMLLLVLKEIVRERVEGTVYIAGFNIARFRPLNKNFSVFKKILKQSMKYKITESA